MRSTTSRGASCRATCASRRSSRRCRGLARANNLALLNVAAGCLEPGESYVEVGTYHGSSLIAALLENDGDFVALDNWSLGDGSREQLDREPRALRSRRPADADRGRRVRARSARGALEGRRVGVYYYDNGHEYEQQLDGMRLIEPYLVDGALVIVDDTDWERVERAVDDYLARAAARDGAAQHRRQGPRPPGVVGGHARPPLVG